MIRLVNDNKVICECSNIKYAKMVADENKDWAFTQWIFRGNTAYACREVDFEDWHRCLQVPLRMVVGK